MLYTKSGPFKKKQKGSRTIFGTSFDVIACPPLDRSKSHTELLQNKNWHKLCHFVFYYYGSSLCLFGQAGLFKEIRIVER